MNKFTDEEITILKKIAKDRITFNEIFNKDKDGKEIPKGNYSEYVKAMKGSSQTTGSGKQ